MSTVTLGVASRDAVKARALAAFRGDPQGNFISFASPELLFQTLTLLRWGILKMMTGAGPMTIREVARRVERDVRRVHDDVSALLACGVLERTDTGEIVFPYDEIHVDFTLQNQAA